MELLITLLHTLNALSPLAVIALLVLVLFYQARNNKTHADGITQIRTNDLHELPQILESLRRIEQSLAENFAAIRTLLERR